MGLSRLSKQCRECRYAKTCQHKRMEAIALVTEASSSLTEPIAMPALAKHDYRNVKIADNTVVTIDLEELKTNMRESFYKNNFNVFRSAT